MWGRFCLKLKKNRNFQVVGILRHILQMYFAFIFGYFFCIKKVHEESPDQFFEKTHVHVVSSCSLLLAAAVSI